MSIEGKSLTDLIRESLTESDESARAYLRENWIATAVAALRTARRDACLSQGEIAERMGTTQSAIARLENDEEGKISLHRFVDYLLSCGKMPLDVETQSFAQVRDFATTCPEGPFYGSAFNHWRSGGILGRAPAMAAAPYTAPSLRNGATTFYGGETSQRTLIGSVQRDALQKFVQTWDSIAGDDTAGDVLNPSSVETAVTAVASSTLVLSLRYSRVSRQREAA